MNPQIAALRMVLDYYRGRLEREGGCFVCDSSPHRGGQVFHDEDCFIPKVEEALEQ